MILCALSGEIIDISTEVYSSLWSWR